VIVVLDTNVFVSGVFFSGPPYRILCAWRDGSLEVVVSPEIVAEYVRVGEELAKSFLSVDLSPALSLLAAAGEIVEAEALPEQVCADPDDDKFLACALSARCQFVISGDKHFLEVSGYQGVTVLRPRAFVESHLLAE
jgi:putative PIN family toxin of toxin-antitoxin system